jgi:hypothetical protein
MAGFLYFIPGAKTSVLPEKMGLGYAFEPGSLLQRRECTGPGEVRGVLLADGRYCPSERCKYAPQEQRWRNVPGTACHVGMWVDSPPGPEDLALDSQLDGHVVALGDGHPWLAPVVRGVREEEDGALLHYVTVSRRIDWDEEGNRITGEVVPERAALWQAAARWYDLKVSAEVAEERATLFGEIVTGEAALVGLAANYRIGRAEASLLQLLDEANEIAILNAMIDWPSWERYLKKKQAHAISLTDDGPPAATAATDPASQT